MMSRTKKGSCGRCERSTLMSQLGPLETAVDPLVEIHYSVCVAGICMPPSMHPSTRVQNCTDYSATVLSCQVTIFDARLLPSSNITVPNFGRRPRGAKQPLFRCSRQSKTRKRHKMSHLLSLAAWSFLPDVSSSSLGPLSLSLSLSMNLLVSCITNLPILVSPPLLFRWPPVSCRASTTT